jgi:site-specific recombinase XerD
MDSALRSLLANYPRGPNTEFIFTNANGDRLRDIRTGFKNARTRAGLNDLRFHDLRHSFASFWVSDGGDLYLLKDMLGHK